MTKRNGGKIMDGMTPRTMPRPFLMNGLGGY